MFWVRRGTEFPELAEILTGPRGQSCSGRLTRSLLELARGKPLRFDGLEKAEGTGLEPATPYGASHFQCDR
jgi:hypothetical protein